MEQSDLFKGTHSSVVVCLITSHLEDAPLFRIPVPAGTANIRVIRRRVCSRAVIGPVVPQKPARSSPAGTWSAGVTRRKVDPSRTVLAVKGSLRRAKTPAPCLTPDSCIVWRLTPARCVAPFVPASRWAHRRPHDAPFSTRNGDPHARELPNARAARLLARRRPHESNELHGTQFKT